MNAPRALRLRDLAAISIGGVLLRLLGASWRIRRHGAEEVERRNARGERMILLLWHGQMLSCAYSHRLPAAVMVSEHRDGEIIAQVLRGIGLDTIRGSTSRGGARVLLQAAERLAQGIDVAITPDGPRGPRHAFAPGALALAFRSGVAMTIIVTHSSRAWRLRSWDAFEIPKPFARVDVLYADAPALSASALRDATAQADVYATAMREAAAHVAELARRS